MEHLKDLRVPVVGICGSLREGGYTEMALKIALAGSQSVGALTTLIDLNSYDLPFCDGRPSADYPDSVHKLRDAVGAATGIILATPEYHGSYYGVLKNALDLMSFEQLEGKKMVGLIGVAGGAVGAISSLTALRSVGRQLHAWVVPDQVSIAKAWQVFDDDGNTKQQDLQQRLEQVGKQVARFGYLHTAGKSMEFLQSWERAMENPGGKLE